MFAVRHRHRPSNKGHKQWEEDEDDEDALVAKAALKIQSVWRGRQTRDDPTRFTLPEQQMTSALPFLGATNRIRREIYSVLEEPQSGNLARMSSISVLIMIVLSIICLICETIPSMKDPANVSYVEEVTWYRLEVFCTVVFTLEFVLRVSVCNVYAPFKDFWTNPINLFDFLAIIPFYVEWAMEGSKGATFLRVLRAVRLSRLFRIFRLGRYSRSLRLMGSAIFESMNALYVLIFFLAIGVILFASMAYYIEKQSCPDFVPPITEQDLVSFGEYTDECRRFYKSGMSPTYGLCCDISGAPYDFEDIPHSFWWAIVTMTTVGFGDVVPRTPMGRVVGTCGMLCGILLIALPVAIVGRNFQDAYEKLQDETILDTSRTLGTKDFKQKLDASPCAPPLPMQAMDEDLDAIYEHFVKSSYKEDRQMSTKFQQMRQLAEQIQTAHGTLHRIQIAEQLQQDRIFKKAEELFTFLNMKKGRTMRT